MPSYLKPSLNWLLVFVPAAVVLHYKLPERALLVFGASCLAIIPLAGWMGRATEELAERTGEAIGGLLNAAFGNAAELIIALVAMQAGHYDIVKASLTGSIIGNLLLVLGASFLAGGLKFKHQRYSAALARNQTTILTLAAVALVAPMGFHYFAHSAATSGLAPGEAAPHEHDLSFAISIVLLLTYGLSLIFSLHTHKQLFVGSGSFAAVRPDAWSVKRAVGVLLVATALIAWISEFLVGSVELAAHELGMSSVFVGVIVVAIIGNAAEHSTAILMALKDRMQLSLSIAIGSSLQIALFVAPVLVLASYALGKAGPMDLNFTPPEVIAVLVSVLIIEQICTDGESNWMEGAQLLSLYLIIALVFYYLPVPGGH